MDIFQAVHEVLATMPQTPREFLMAAYSEDWQHAAIYRYPLAEGGPYCYQAILWTLCPDCQDMHLHLAVFTEREGGFRLLQADWGDVAHESV